MFVGGLRGCHGWLSEWWGPRVWAGWCARVAVASSLSQKDAGSYGAPGASGPLIAVFYVWLESTVALQLCVARRHSRAVVLVSVALQIARLKSNRQEALSDRGWRSGCGGRCSQSSFEDLSLALLYGHFYFVSVLEI